MNANPNDGKRAELFTAVLRNDLEATRRICRQHRECVALQDPQGFTSLYCACSAGFLPIARYLVQHFPQLLHIDANGGFSPLYIAAAHGHLEIVTYLAGIEPELARKGSEENYTPCYISSAYGRTNVCRWIAENYPDQVDVLSVEGFSALYISSGRGHLECTQYLAETYPRLLDVNSAEGFSCLYIASARGHLPVVTYLAELAPRLHTVASNAGLTPLYMSVARDHFSCCQWLAEHGKEALEIASKEDGFTPLMIAAHQGKMEYCRMLLEAGANPRARSRSGDSPSEVAETQRHRDVARLLKEAEDAPVTRKVPMEGHSEDFDRKLLVAHLQTILKLLQKRHGTSFAERSPAMLCLMKLKQFSSADLAALLSEDSADTTGKKLTLVPDLLDAEDATSAGPFVKNAHIQLLGPLVAGKGVAPLSSESIPLPPAVGSVVWRAVKRQTGEVVRVRGLLPYAGVRNGYMSLLHHLPSHGLMDRHLLPVDQMFQSSSSIILNWLPASAQEGAKPRTLFTVEPEVKTSLLSFLADRSGAVSPLQGALILMQLCEAIKTLGECSLLHTGISASNVLLQEDGWLLLSGLDGAVRITSAAGEPKLFTGAADIPKWTSHDVPPEVDPVESDLLMIPGGEMTLVDAFGTSDSYSGGMLFLRLWKDKMTPLLEAIAIRMVQEEFEARMSAADCAQVLSLLLWGGDLLEQHDKMAILLEDSAAAADWIRARQLECLFSIGGCPSIVSFDIGSLRTSWPPNPNSADARLRKRFLAGLTVEKLQKAVGLGLGLI